LTGGSPMAPNEIDRFDYGQRVLHWVVALSFVLLLLTGLGFSYPSLYWINALLGGAATARALHPWAGLVFSAGMFWMFVTWVADMRIGPDDRAWLAAVRHYLRHEHDRVPSSGRYNAGQKLFFWLAAASALLLLVTGLPLWYPQGLLGSGRFAAGTLTFMRLLHYLGALASGLLLIPHFYLATVAVPGTLAAMLRGRVSRAWARHHHQRWFEEHAGR